MINMDGTITGKLFRIEDLTIEILDNGIVYGTIEECDNTNLASPRLISRSRGSVTPMFVDAVKAKQSVIIFLKKIIEELEKPEG